MRIVSIKKVNPETVYAITTSTGTFIADGLAHHNCWRCNLKHEYEPNHYINWYVGKYGLERHTKLIREGNVTPKYKDWQLKDMLEDRKQILRRMKDEEQSECNQVPCQTKI